MQNSRSRKIIVILDCCFSGAFANLLKKGNASVDFERLSVRGSVVLASSSPNEVSYQPKGSAIDDRPLSLYTRFLIEGMEGLAQQQHREWIDAQDLHEYAVRKLQTEYAAAAPPKIIVAEEEGYRLPIVRAPKADPQTQYRQFVDALLQELDQAPDFEGEIDPDSLDREVLDVEREHLEIPLEVAAQIEAELQAPFRSRAQKRKRYEQALKKAIREIPFSDRTRRQLKQIQNRLSLTDADAEAIEERLFSQMLQLLEAAAEIAASSQSVEPETTKIANVQNLQYQKLEEYLRNGQWKEADKETYRLMITAVGKEEGQWFEPEELLNFPCNVLKALDILWVKYSNGHFGFSVQKEIYLECGGIPDGQYHEEAWNKFCHANGWMEDNEFIDLTFNISSLRGHIPVDIFVDGNMVDWCGGVGVSSLLVSSLASRLVKCKL
ncbi:GUN4 domain-containing protein [Cyanobacteria bacterium FACHB-63]|nr:GUN4 domain-containing protein [Cyanobacteria bacterium FACHB-63]